MEEIQSIQGDDWAGGRVGCRCRHLGCQIALTPATLQPTGQLSEYVGRRLLDTSTSLKSSNPEIRFLLQSAMALDTRPPVDAQLCRPCILTALPSPWRSWDIQPGARMSAPACFCPTWKTKCQRRRCALRGRLDGSHTRCRLYRRHMGAKGSIPDSWTNTPSSTFGRWTRWVSTVPSTSTRTPWSVATSTSYSTAPSISPPFPMYMAPEILEGSASHLMQG